MTTFTTEDRIAACTPTVIVDSGASYEPIPFAGLVSISDQDFEFNLSPTAIKVNYPSDPQSA